MDWMALKSGTDVRGTAVGEGTTLRNDVAEALGMAFAQWVAAKCQKPVNDIRIAIGRDSRITGPDLLAATARGISPAADAAPPTRTCRSRATDRSPSRRTRGIPERTRRRPLPRWLCRAFQAHHR